jgi:colanic acid biosynthesis glycosyl transferase WcaI
MAAFAFYQALACLVGLRLTYDAVLITNPALESGLPFLFLSVLRRKPSLFCVWDLYPEVGITLGVFRRSAVMSLVKILEDFCLQRATAVQTLADAFVPNLKQRVRRDTKIHVIPAWIDTEFIAPLPRANRFSAEHGLHERFVVLYAGNLGLSQGLDNVLLAAKGLSSQRRSIQFVLVGDGPNKENLVAQAGKLRLDNVCFIPFQPRERLPEVLATADLALVSLQPGVADGSLPSKTFPILASGRPILAVAERGSELHKLMQVSQAGVCIPPSNREALSGAILDFEGNKELCGRFGKMAREYAIRNHSRASAALRFEKILEQIASTSSKESFDA